MALWSKSKQSSSHDESLCIFPHNHNRPFIKFSTLALISTLFLAFTSTVSAQLCATSNTGESSSLDVSIYQSNGLCQSHCAGYAYAVLQGKQCWCSDYTPASTEDLSNCSEKCPGYPDDVCGDMAKGFFYYILLGTPKGTAGAESKEEESKTSDSQPSSATEQSSSSEEQPPSSSSSEEAPPPSSSSSSSSPSEPPQTTLKPSVILSVLTVTGNPEVETITQDKVIYISHSGSTSITTLTTSSFSIPSSTSSSSSSTSSAISASSEKGVINSAGSTSTAEASVNESEGKSFFDNKGAVAGVFTAVGIVAVLIILGLLFFITRRRRSDEEDASNRYPGGGKGSPYTETKPTMHILGAGAGTAGTNASDDTYSDLVGGKPPSPYFDEKSGQQIVPIEVDQRLDPAAVYMRWDHTDSRRSLQDDHDYSRKVLRVTNPDYGRESLESSRC